MEEIWKDIPGYERIYQASNLWRIRSAPGKKTITEYHGVRTRLIDCNDGYIDFPSLSSASRYLGRSSGYLNLAIKMGRVIRDVYGEVYKVQIGQDG